MSNWWRDSISYRWSTARGTFVGATDGPDARWTAPDRVGIVVIRVEVADGRGGTAAAELAINVGNRSPVFGPPLRFQIAENRDGRGAPVTLGRIRASDPDGDDVEMTLGSGSDRFAIDGATGALSYVGPGEDFEADPNRYALAVRAADTLGAEAHAEVVVDVVDVNEHPAAADDTLSVAEDGKARVEVLANDDDPDRGDRIRVVSVGAPAHGQGQVVGAGAAVEYVPDPNYHGPDRFAYVVADAAGLADTATVEVTVTPVNDGPEAAGTIPDQRLDEGGDGATVDLTPFFTDIDGDPLVFSAETSNADVVTAAVQGAALVLLPVAYGDAAVIVTATDPGGLAATQRLAVGVSDRAGRAVLSDALAATARSYLSSARMTLERRAALATHAGSTDAGRQSGLRVGGRSVALPDRHALWDAAKQIAAEWLPDPGGSPLNRIRPPAVISGTDFTLAWDGQVTDSARPGISWSLWGQTDVQRYDGGTAEPGSGLAGIGGDYDGDLRVRYLGLDAQLPNWLFGLALGSSRGAGNWYAGTAAGRLSTTMTSLHPYLRWSSGATSFWTTFGAGRGEARNERTATGRIGTSPLDLAMGLVEFRRRLGPAGGPVEFGLRADAGWANLSTGEGTETIDDLRGRVHQARLGLDVRSEMRVGGAELAPFGAVHLRNDGGDGRTGRGVELSGGLRTRIGVVGLDAQGRWLAYHSATGYGESGAGLTLTLGGREPEGFSLSASPHWGGETGGGHALWRERAPGMTPGPDAPPTGWTMDVSGAYRARLGGRLLEVATAYDQTSGGHRLRLTGQIGLGLSDQR